MQTIFIVFGGVYVTADNVPSYLKWLPRTSLIKYAYEGLCVNEFRGTDFETTGASGDLATGDQASGSALMGCWAAAAWSLPPRVGRRIRPCRGPCVALYRNMTVG